MLFELEKSDESNLTMLGLAAGVTRVQELLGGVEITDLPVTGGAVTVSWPAF